jgi:4-hydroxy-tetrahydrodipicolinate synthase
MALDIPSLIRMMDHHVRLGISGVFIGGTNGEGPWLPDRDRWALVRAVVETTAKRMPVAVQVTDNSAARIIDNMHRAWDYGAQVAVIAPPFFLLNANAKTLTALYCEAIDACPLPVGIYDRGNAGAVAVPDEALKAIYAHPKVVMIKDSSMSPARREIALTARRKRPGLVLLNGWEFNCVDYLTAGYDGLLLGGGVFNGYLAGMIMQAVQDGKLALAHRLQRRMNRLMYDVYGGKKIACWLAGEKKLLCELGIFSTWKNTLHYPLTAACARAIARALEREREVLLP